MAAVFFENAYRGTAAERAALLSSGVTIREKEAFIEIDTGKIYFYNNGEWVEFKES